MKKYTIYLLFLVLLPLCHDASAQTTDTDSSSKTEFLLFNGKSSPEGARFEVVIPSNSDSNCIFRIDKYTGDVWRLWHAIGSSNKLVLLEREPSEMDLAEEDKINYQLVSISPTEAYLINLNTGIIWEFWPSLFSKKNNIFSLIEDD